MRELTSGLFLIASIFCNTLFAQDIELEGYVYETGNRGYLNMVSVKVYDMSNQLVTSTGTDMSGLFKVNLQIGQEYIISTSKDIFKERKMLVSTIGKTSDEKLFLKVEMKREPGYIFDVTLASKRTKKQIKAGLPADAIAGAHVEVYNNTKERQILDLKETEFPNFKIHFEDGNHYTIMIRKKGFFTKRMEAYVNVEGCILCFDGVGEVKPGVSDIMTEKNTMGTLLANVEMKPVEIGKAIKVEKIYYDKSSYKIRKDAAEELDKLITFLKDNPALLIELGSHTDSRGDTKSNEKLSQNRAESAVKYITNDTGIEKWRIRAKGYGESKLVNSCKNGVECSERRHEKNRRTEIKVTGTLANDPYDNLSLNDIIQKEKMEKMLEDILNQEIVEVKAGEELPEEIKKQMESSNEHRSTTAAEGKKVESHESNTEEIHIEKVEVITVPKNKVGASLPVKTEKNEETIASSKIEQAKDPVVRNPSKNKASKLAKADKKETMIFDELEVEVNHRPTVPQFIDVGYTGYMVEFYSAALELPPSHEIFSKHGKIYKEQKKDGTYAYLFGPFKEWRDANRFLESTIIENYKASKVIRYKKGKRIAKN